MFDAFAHGERRRRSRAGILAFLFLILLPLLGILGWLTGRGIAWILAP